MNLRDMTPLDRLTSPAKSALNELRALLDGGDDAAMPDDVAELAAAAAAMLADPNGRRVIEWLADKTLRAPPVHAPPGATIEQTAVQVLQWQARAGLVSELLQLAAAGAGR